MPVIAPSPPAYCSLGVTLGEIGCYFSAQNQWQTTKLFCAGVGFWATNPVLQKTRFHWNQQIQIAG
jgi:hypothetical protein